MPGTVFSLEPAEELLALAAHFTRFTDAHLRSNLRRRNPVDVLITQADAAQDLARTALGIVTTLDAQSMYLSPEIRAVYARVRQLAHLTSDATEHLLAAEDILVATRSGLPVPTGDGFMTVPTQQQAHEEVGRRFDLVAERLSLGAYDAVSAAELYLADRRRRGHVPGHQPPALSRAQRTTLHAIAQGDVTISGGRPSLRRDDLRVSISTIRSLESHRLVTREPCPLPLQDERLALTPGGRRDLAATISSPPARKAPGTIPAPAAVTAKTTARSR